jgi:hypothetical protein
MSKLGLEREDRTAEGIYPRTSVTIYRYLVLGSHEVWFGRGGRIWPPAQRLRSRSLKKSDLFLLAVGGPPLQILSTVYLISHYGRGERI